VLVGVCHGFVGNRMLAQRQREAQKLILEGAMPWDVDRVLYDFGLPMGPFAMSDLAGLDIGWDATKSTSRPSAKCCARWTGAARRTARASTTTTRTASPSRERGRAGDPRLSPKSARSSARDQRPGDPGALPVPMVNEGAKILEEGKAIRASDIDTVWINGYGWPVYTRRSDVLGRAGRASPRSWPR
jgi:3-hydroxyacyl-CoA dehydrogenase